MIGQLGLGENRPNRVLIHLAAILYCIDFSTSDPLHFSACYPELVPTREAVRLCTCSDLKPCHYNIIIIEKRLDF